MPRGGRNEEAKPGERKTGRETSDRGLSRLLALFTHRTTADKQLELEQRPPVVKLPPSLGLCSSVAAQCHLRS